MHARPLVPRSLKNGLSGLRMPWLNVWDCPDELSKVKRLAMALPAAAGPETATAIAIPAPMNMPAVLIVITLPSRLSKTKTEGKTDRGFEFLSKAELGWCWTGCSGRLDSCGSNQRRSERLGIERLADVIVHACLQARFTIF